MTNNQLSANDRVARTLAALDFGSEANDPEAFDEFLGEPFADTEASPAIRRTADALDCSLAAAAYIAALENRVAALEEKVSELRYDVRKVRRAA